jgi:hypothetical protein
MSLHRGRSSQACRGIEIGQTEAEASLPRIFMYVVRHDGGFSPNPFHGWCTLACCPSSVRRPRLGTGFCVSRLEGCAGAWFTRRRSERCCPSRTTGRTRGSERNARMGLTERRSSRGAETTATSQCREAASGRSGEPATGIESGTTRTWTPARRTSAGSTFSSGRDSPTSASKARSQRMADAREQVAWRYRRDPSLVCRC